MPLQTGATAFRTISHSFILIPFVWGLWPLLVIPLMLRDARKRRASDLLFEANGLTLEGGANPGLAWGWNERGLTRNSFEPTEELFVKVGDAPAQYVHRLTIDGIVVAETGDRVEIDSIAIVLEVIRTLTEPDAPRPAPSVEVARCGSCGAPLVPADAETVCCQYCAASNPMPSTVRQRLHEANALNRTRRVIQENVSRAIRSGDAERTNAALKWFAISGFATLPLSFLMFAIADWTCPLALLLPFIVGGHARCCIAYRLALRSLVLGCTAITPNDPTHPSLCRSCRAPLPAPSDGIVVNCAYCNTPNLLGLSLGRPTEVTAELGEIEKTIAHQRRSIRRGRAFIATAVVLGAMWILAHVVSAGPGTWVTRNWFGRWVSPAHRQRTTRKSLLVGVSYAVNRVDTCRSAHAGTAEL